MDSVRELDQRLDDEALRVAKRVLQSLTVEWGPVPPLSSVACANLTAAAGLNGEPYGAVVSLCLLHPRFSILVSRSIGDIDSATMTGFSEIHFNAMDEDGLICILKVRVIAWLEG